MEQMRAPQHRSFLAGHDENAATAKLGRPVERMIKMAKGMLEVVRTFKMPRGVPLQIRIGTLMRCICELRGPHCPISCFHAENAAEPSLIPYGLHLADFVAVENAGIHCGPAFAGVIGSKCPRYCFLGEH